ncbi:MAG: leucyl/phenylalanyl-tRNA--protein transferase [Rhizobiales bacterium]|nr:leucyl/phenylalanyl-tRNA--protein transferase [Hyphomicrobiales bacterium]
MSPITPLVLLKAYAAGVFPMAESADDPALYWVEPDERGLIPLDGLVISRSLRKAVKQRRFDIRIDTAFEEVMRRCAERTTDRKETWINQRILKLYADLFRMGHCHSVESWQDGKLVGGLYGVRLGAVFFGESMFSRVTDASKVALVHLVARLNAGGFRLLDAQFMNPHLATLGAISMNKADYLALLGPAVAADADFQRFKGDNDPQLVLDWASPR